MIDVAGQEATEAYDDAGHSDEADETLSRYLIGRLDGPERAGVGKRRNKGVQSSQGVVLLGFLLRIVVFMLVMLVGCVVFSVFRV